MLSILKTNFLGLLLLFTFSSSAQVLLDVCGDAKILGRADISTTDGSIFIGTNAGNSDDGTTNNNTFIGTNAGPANTSGSFNTFVGQNAGQQNTTASNNTFMGDDAGQNNNTGGSNTFLGQSAGELNSSGGNNTFVGQDAGQGNILGSSNVYVGENAGRISATGNSNTFLGQNAGVTNGGGDNNTFVGQDAGQINTSGDNNTMLGENAGQGNTTGNGGTMVGRSAGQSLSMGDNNTAIGTLADFTVDGITNATALGHAATVDASNKIVIGNMAATPIGGWDAWTDYGVAGPGLRQKNKGSVKGLDFILKLKPLTYRIDYLKQAEKTYGAGADTIVVDAYRDALIEKSKINQTGFIATDVVAAAEAATYDFNGIVSPSHKNGTYGLKYGLFTVPLVKSVQELHAGYEDLKAENAALKAEMTELKHLVQQLVQNRSTATEMTVPPSDIPTASLSTNQPNPFSKTTSISYVVPTTAEQAQLRITQLNGQIVKQYSLSTGAGQIDLNSQQLGKGTYIYSLIVNHQLVASQQMVVQ